MRILSSVFAIVAALVFIAAAAAMNWHFMVGQGKTDTEGYILGGVSVAVDVFKAVLPILIVAAYFNRRWSFVGVGSLLFTVFFCFSMLSALGFAAGNRGAVTGGREALTARHALAAGELATIDRRLTVLASNKPSAAIEAELEGLRQSPRWKSSASCTDATASLSREFCASYHRARAELAEAVEAQRLRAQADTLKREVERLQELGAGQDKDAQAGFLARLSGMDVSTAQMGWIGFVAVVVELGAAFGLYLATGHGPRRAPLTPAPAAGHAVVVVEPRPKRINPPRAAAKERAEAVEAEPLIIEGPLRFQRSESIKALRSG